MSAIFSSAGAAPDVRPDDDVARLRVPPHSAEAEQSVLGGLLLDNGAWDRMGDLLPHLVQTVATEGLTEADIERAASILTPRPVSMLRPVYPDSLTRTSAPTYTYRDAQDGA